MSHQRRASPSDSSDDEPRPQGNVELLAMFTEDKTRARGVSISSVSSADFDLPAAPASGDEGNDGAPAPVDEADGTPAASGAGASQPAAQPKRRPAASAADSFRAMCFKKVSHAGLDGSDSGSDGDGGPATRRPNRTGGGNASGLAAIPAAELVDFLSMMAESAANTAITAAVPAPMPEAANAGESADLATATDPATAIAAAPKVELPADKPLAAAWNGAAAVAEAVSLLGDILILRPVKKKQQAAPQGNTAAARGTAAKSQKSSNTLTLDAGCVLLLLPTAGVAGTAENAESSSGATVEKQSDATDSDQQLPVVGHVNAIFGHVASCRYVVRVPADRLEKLRALIRCPPRETLQDERTSDEDGCDDAAGDNNTGGRFLASRFAVAADSLALVPDLEFLTMQSRANATDASHVEDNELPENATPDFSDDEKERTFKAERKAARKARREQLLASGMSVEAARRHERELYGACAEDDDVADGSDREGSVELEFDAEGNVIGEKKRPPRAVPPPQQQRGRGGAVGMMADPYRSSHQMPSLMNARGGRGGAPMGSAGAFGMAFPPPPTHGSSGAPLSVTVGGRGGMLAPHMIAGGRGASFGAGLPPHHYPHNPHAHHHHHHHDQHRQPQPTQLPQRPLSALDMYMQAGAPVVPRGPAAVLPPFHHHHHHHHQYHTQQAHHHHHIHAHAHAQFQAAAPPARGGFMDHPAFQEQQQQQQYRGAGVVVPPAVAPLATELARASRSDRPDRDGDRHGTGRTADRSAKKRHRSYSSSSSDSSFSSSRSRSYSSSSSFSSGSYDSSDDSASSRRSDSSETTAERRRRRRRERERRERKERERRRRDRERRRRQKEKEERRRRREKEHRRSEREGRPQPPPALPVAGTASAVDTTPTAGNATGTHGEATKRRSHRDEGHDDAARRSSRSKRDSDNNAAREERGHRKKRSRHDGRRDDGDSWSASVRGGDSAGEREPKRRRREPSLDGASFSADEGRDREDRRRRRERESRKEHNRDSRRDERQSSDHRPRDRHRDSRDGFPPPPPPPADSIPPLAETAMHRL
jgi:hypothetical protein